MSNSARDWARKLPLASFSEKAVLKELGDRANEKLECHPGLEQLAFDTALSTRTVTAALKALEEKGLISRSRRYRGYQHRSTGDVYVVHVGMTVEPEQKKNAPRGKPPVKKPTAEVAAVANVATHEGPEITAHERPESTAESATFATDDKPQNPAKFAGHEAPAVANVAPSVANVATALTVEPPVNPHHHHPEVTQERSGDELPNVDDELPRDRDDDDDDFDAERVVDAVLSGLDPRLSHRAIADRLARSPDVDLGRIDILAATLAIWQRRTQTVSNPVAYVAQAIANDPDNPEFAAMGTLRATASSVAPTADKVCASRGHRYIGEFEEFCATCGHERPDWRNDRDAAMAARGAAAR